MTTIAAVKKGKRLCLASDSLTLFGSRKEIAGIHVEEKGKIIQVGANYIGIAGHPSWSLIFKHYFSKKKNISAWATPDQLFDVFFTFHRNLKKDYYLAPSFSHYEPFRSSEFELLIINSNGIFEVDYLKTVRQYSQFSAIGTGEEYALGAIKAVYDMCNDAREIAKIGITASVEFDKKTGAPLEVCCIEL